MKCLCFSDSHGSSYYINKALALHPDAEVIFFLGDGLSDIERVWLQNKNICILAVRGNCDHSSAHLGTQICKTEAITLEGYRIAYTHGDLYGAKYGSGGLLRLADELEADIVLFGHTHSPYERYEKTEKGRGVYLFNPGSIGMGGFGGGASYGVIMLSESGVLLSHGQLDRG